MDKIYIFTDSSSDIPPALVERYQIDIAPIKVTYEGRTLREYYDITPQAYWKILEQTKDIPVTTQATPVQYFGDLSTGAAGRLHPCARRDDQCKRLRMLSIGLYGAGYVL